MIIPQSRQRRKKNTELPAGVALTSISFVFFMVGFNLLGAFFNVGTEDNSGIPFAVVGALMFLAGIVSLVIGAYLYINMAYEYFRRYDEPLFLGIYRYKDASGMAILTGVLAFICT